MDPKDLRAHLEAATPGPWLTCSDRDHPDVFPMVAGPKNNQHIANWKNSGDATLTGLLRAVAPLLLDLWVQSEEHHEYAMHHDEWDIPLKFREALQCLREFQP